MNINNPKITIVTVTYNAEQFLERTIKSVIEQEYKNIEYIIIDGGSTDKTLDIIKKYESNIDYWISESDSGIYDAMNKGTLKSNGDYINYLNAGDIYTNSLTLSLIAKSNTNNSDVIYGGANLWYEDENRHVYDSPRDPSSIYNRLPCVHQTMFIKKDIMLNNLYNTYFRLSSDVELFFKLYTKKYNFKIIQKPLVNFLMGGISQEDKAKSHIEVLAIANKYLKNGNDLYKHSSYTALVANNPNKDSKDNLYFSYMFNKLIEEVNTINTTYKNIIIYGYSHIGRYINSLLTINSQFVDQNYDNINSFNPEILKSKEFDIVIIAVLGREDGIKKYLINNLNVKKEKIKELEI